MGFAGFTNILVPVDFSRSANRAYIYALELARCNNSRVTLVHVLDTHFFSSGVHIVIQPLEESLAKWRRRAEAKLVSTYRRHQELGLKVETQIREGKPAEEILGAARSTKADLIIIGTHARKGLEKAIFGSVAERVMRTSPIPVLLLK